MNEAFLLEEFGREPLGDRDVALATLETVWLRVAGRRPSARDAAARRPRGGAWPWPGGLRRLLRGPARACHAEPSAPRRAAYNARSPSASGLRVRDPAARRQPRLPTSTSVERADGKGGGPVNQFSNVRRLTKPSDKTVVAPNHDTLYSMAWLDLTRQPIIAHMPVVKHRFVVFELVDPYTHNFAAIGSVGYPPGDYAIVPPGWHRRLPLASADRLAVHARRG